MKYIITSFVALVLTVGVFPLSTFACSFTSDADRMKPASQNISKYPTIFVGKIVGKENKNTYEGVSYTFEVEKVYKGEIQEKQIVINTPGHSCGSYIEKGAVGLFFFNLDKPTWIDETLPQYYFNSVVEATATADKLFNPNAGQAASVGVPVISTTTTSAAPSEDFDSGIMNGQLVSNPFAFKGSTGLSQDWVAFEGQVGYVELKDSQGKLLDTSPMNVVGEWMKPTPHEFKVWLEYKTTDSQGTLVFHNDNVSGLAKDIAFEVPVRFNQGDVVAPNSNPGENFREPTSPPPYDNSVPKYDSAKFDWGILDTVLDFFGGLFGWIKS